LEKTSIWTLDGRDSCSFYGTGKGLLFNEEARGWGDGVTSFETLHHCRKNFFTLSHNPKIDIEMLKKLFGGQRKSRSPDDQSRGRGSTTNPNNLLHFFEIRDGSWIGEIIEVS
jgi:hypothetical protein